MSETTHATIRAGVEQFRKMIEQSSLEGETEHDDLYMNVMDDEVRILQQAPGEVVLTYCSFGEDYFDEIDLHKDMGEAEGTDRSGNDFTYRVGAEAILEVDRTLTYLDFAAEGGTIELHLSGEEDQRLSTYVRAEGALEAWVKLPGSQDIISEVPHWLPLRFDADDAYCNPQGDPAPTVIDTNISKLETIIRAVNEDRDAEYFPIVVQDGDFQINIGDESRSGVQGTLGAKKVEGPDVENYYFDGFEEIVEVLSGPITLQTAPDSNPLAFVQTGSDGRVIRHVNGTVSN